MADADPAHTVTPPRERILEAAIELMRRSGLSGAGLNPIVAASGAPKGSLYHYFPDGKLQIAAEALTLYGHRVEALFAEALSRGLRPRDRITALFRMVAARLEDTRFGRSCAAGAVALDLDAETESLRPVLREVLASWQALIARHLPLATRASTESFAGMVLSAIEGGYVRGRAEHSSAPLLEAGKWLAALYDAETARRSRPARTRKVT